jgi:toxin ParE1/3/4
MAEVVWSRNATKQFVRITAYIAERDLRAARDYADRLQQLADSLSEFPDRGRPAGRHREMTTVPPFVMRYRVSGDLVTIVAIRHGRQARRS